MVRNRKEEAKQLKVFGQLPNYAAAARLYHMTGSGVFTLNVDTETGVVTSVQVEKGTGWGFLMLPVAGHSSNGDSSHTLSQRCICRSHSLWTVFRSVAVELTPDSAR